MLDMRMLSWRHDDFVVGAPNHHYHSLISNMWHIATICTCIRTNQICHLCNMHLPKSSFGPTTVNLWIVIIFTRMNRVNCWAGGVCVWPQHNNNIELWSMLQHSICLYDTQLDLFITYTKCCVCVCNYLLWHNVHRSMVNACTVLIANSHCNATPSVFNFRSKVFMVESCFGERMLGYFISGHNKANSALSEPDRSDHRGFHSQNVWKMHLHLFRRMRNACIDVQRNALVAHANNIFSIIIIIIRYMYYYGIMHFQRRLNGAKTPC